jgi:large subunit ribosomal protein L13
MIVIDANDLLVGRMATFAAKKALMGETVRIINCEKAYISGSKKQIVANVKDKREMGTHTTGPFYPRYPDRMVKRIIRGMLPYKKTRGKEAFKRIVCYIGTPEEMKKEKAISVESAHISKLPNIKFMEIKTLSKYLGAKIE